MSNINDVQVDVRDYLVNTVGLANVSIGRLTPSPIDQYAVIEFPGLRNVKTMGAGVVLDESNVQIEIRHTSAQTAWTLAQNIVDAMDNLGGVTINSNVYTYVDLMMRPRILDVEESGAVVIYLELRLQARRT